MVDEPPYNRFTDESDLSASDIPSRDLPGDEEDTATHARAPVSVAAGERASDTVAADDQDTYPGVIAAGGGDGPPGGGSGTLTGPPDPDPEPEAETSAQTRRVLPIDDEASNLVAQYLFPTERYRGEWKQHAIALAVPMSIGLVATFLLGWWSGMLARSEEWAWLTAVLLLLWLAVMGFVGWRVADWHFDRFVLTNKRVMKVSGIITRNVAMMPLSRVTDMKYIQTPMGRALDYGTFIVESAGQEQALREIPHLPRPNELYLRVVEEMYEPLAVEARLGGGDFDEEQSRADHVR